jgi:C_GCAxxG_C_C family probable redox protein
MTSNELFTQGYNCAQAVFLTHAGRFGITPEMAQRLAAPLGGGLGGLRRTCGALTAVCLLAGLKQGGYDPNDLGAKTRFYELIQRLDAEFAAEFGSSQCAVLLADAECQVSSTPSARSAAYYAARPCGRCVALADQLVERHLGPLP